VEFRILGPMEVAADGEPVELGAPKQRALLGALLLRPNEVVSRDRLIDALWGDTPPPTAAKTVQVYISQLRRALASAGADEVLLTRPPGYMAVVGEEQLDAQRFEQLLDAARAHAARGELDEAVAAYDDALSRWRGAVLADLPLEASGRSACERLEELRLAALDERVECELARGRHGRLVGELESLTAEHPLHERFWAQLMLALYRSGRQSEALAAYRRARDLLSEQLGLEPGRELHELERAILTHDRSLGPVEKPGVDDHRPRPRRRSAVLAIAASLVAAAVAIPILVFRGSGRGSPASAVASRVVPNSIGIVDPARNALVGDIRLQTRPSAVVTGAGSLWVAMQDDNTLVRIDPHSRKVTRTIGLGATPTALAAAGRYVWAFCAQTDTLIELDADTATPIRTLSLADKITLGVFEYRSTALIAADPTAAWLAAGRGLVTRVDASTGKLQHVGAGSASAVTVGGGAVWAVGALPDFSDVGVLFRIDSRTRHVTEKVRPPNIATSIGYLFGAAADAHAAWVIRGNGAYVWRIDPNLETVSGVFPMPHHPLAIAFGDGSVWTANIDGTISRIDPNMTSARTIPLGSYPRTAYPVALAVGEGEVWVAVH
jgi:DNA-binding SARP family transcriptional activator/streptogramin lyase